MVMGIDGSSLQGLQFFSVDLIYPESARPCRFGVDLGSDIVTGRDYVFLAMNTCHSFTDKLALSSAISKKRSW